MSISSRIAALTTKATPPARVGRLRASATHEFYSIPDPALAQNKISLYRLQTWIQNAIDIPAKMAAATPFNVLEMQGEETKPIANHDFERLLMRPNPRESRFEFLRGTFSWLSAMQDCYWWLNALNETSPIDELWLIPVQQIVPVPDGNMGIRGYLYDPGDGSPLMPLEEWEVIHFKGWNPDNKYVGLSPLEALAMDARGDLAAQRYNTAFYDKDNAKASGILAFADSFAEQGKWERLIAQRNEMHGGTKNNRIMMLRGVGAGGVQWLQTQLTNVDIQYLQQRQFTKEEIYDRLAPGLASALAINANEANSRTGQANLREMCLYPMHTAVAETIAMKILAPRYGENLTAEFDDVRHKDRQLEMLETQEYARYHTIDETRKERFGSDPIGDERGNLLMAEIGKGMTDARDPEDKPEPTPPPQFGSPPPPPQQPAAEAIVEAGKLLDRQRWQKKAIKALLAGRSPDVPFTPDYLADDEAMPIRAGLKKAQTAEDVTKVFLDDEPAEKRRKRVRPEDIDGMVDADVLAAAAALVKELK